MGNDNKKMWIIGVVALIVISAIVYLAMPGSKTGKTGKTSGSNMSKTTDPTQGGVDESDGTSTNSGLGDDRGVTPQFLLSEYMEWAQYPPHSRPLINGNVDLAEPFFVMESPVVMVDSPDAKEPNGYKCHLQPKNWAVIGPSADMNIKLECRDSGNLTIPVKINDVRVFREFDGQRFSTVKADYNDDGRDGDDVAKDNITTFRWRPMKNDWGQMMLEADIIYGKEGKKATVTSSFFSSPGKPAEVTGTFRETMIDGSLVVHATVQVYRAGNYHLEANLKEAAEGNLLAYAVFDGNLKQGSNEVEFLFFGKILRDKGYDGPYIVTDVRGHRVNLAIDPAWHDQGEEGLKKIQAAKTTEPDKELVLPFRDEFKTKPYTISQFSKKAWESDDKSRRIKELEQLSSSN